MKDPKFEIERLKSLVSQYKEELENLSKERNEYLVVSAHQMKSPLLTIIFSINTLLGEYAGKLNAKQLLIISSIKRSAETLQRLIADIIELEKLRSGKVELEDIDFVKTSLSAIEELREKIHEKDIKFDVNLPNMMLVIKGHKLGIKHVVYNLVENAVKYSSSGGEVSFLVDYDAQEKTLTAIIRDRGIGIPESEHENIFREFYRAPNAKRFDATGTGFGMVIVKQVLDSCSGKIGIKSKENEGTQITITLPLVEIRKQTTREDEGREKRRRIIVCGGVAAGPKAAVRARRLDPNAEITIFEKEYFLVYAGCALPFYISGVIKTQRELSEAVSGFQGGPEYLRNVRDINIKNLCEVTSIDRKNKPIRYRDLMSNQEHTMGYDSLILATGSKPVVPEIIGVHLQNIFVLHGVNDSEKIKSALTNDMARDIVILGGGLIGVEVAEALTATGAKVTIVEKQDQILAFLDHELATLVERHMIHKGIRILKNESVSAFIGKKKVEYVQLSNFRIPADLVVLAIGINPNVGLAVQAGLTKGPTGAIAVNEYLQTDDTSIFAAGDCAETWHAILNRPYYLPLGSIANRMGRIAGGNATGRQMQTLSPVTGTIIIKVFDYHVAKTGLNEGEAKKAGFDVISSYVSEYDREPFIAGAELIHIKMSACRNTRKLLGVQIVGKGEVAKRIDIAAMVISRNGKFDEVLSVDLGYAPYYSNAVGAIVVSANVLQNKIDGLFRGISAQDVHTLMQTGNEECVFLDVRTPQEYEEEKIPGFDIIPLENLKNRIDEILPDRKIILTCESGSRSYQASLILKKHGFREVYVLEGGIRMWPYELSHE